MAENKQELLAKFERKMRQLMHLCDVLKDENRLLQVKLSQKSDEVESLRLQLEQLDVDYKNLKFAQSLHSTSSEDVDEAKKRLAKLVRDVDKCIALLKG